jgi:hypothetical protein
LYFHFTPFKATLGDFAHNQYLMRFERLEETTAVTSPSVHFGLTKMELSKLEEPISSAYGAAVRDGYRLGRGYSKLWIQSLGLNVLLFVTSIVGLTKLRNRKRTKNA